MKASRAAIKQVKTLEELSGQIAGLEAQLDRIETKLEALLSKSVKDKPDKPAAGKGKKTEAPPEKSGEAA